MQASFGTKCTSLFCQEVLLSGVDNTSGQCLDYATQKLYQICYSYFFKMKLKPHRCEESQVCLVGVFAFPVETTKDKQPVVSQETEQPSVPVHTGKFIYQTFTLTLSHALTPLYAFLLIFPSLLSCHAKLFILFASRSFSLFF